jgi:CheY-like chemotaxis protein
MPDVDGEKVLEKINELQLPHPPVTFMLTADATSDAMGRCFEKGACEYLTKPLDFDELRLKLSHHFSPKKETEGENQDLVRSNHKEVIEACEEILSLPFIEKENIGDALEHLRYLLKNHADLKACVDDCENALLKQGKNVFHKEVNQLIEQLSK